MKILFAVNNDNISEAIVKKYQKDYREILSYKNVYYFNAILRELQKDKGYSRIVISEDLEPFANNNYDAIDKFLYEKYESIAEEAKTLNNEKIDIILVCADRRKKTDNMLSKIYKNEIYNAIIGQDRSIDTICKLINQPREKSQARVYYGIQESELGQDEGENSVSEAEVENIRVHYARLGKNEDKYVESFNNIVSQYNDTQLRIIIKYLPINVKAVLEERSPKYQQLVMENQANGTTNFKEKTANYKQQIKNKKKEEKDIVVEELSKKKKVGTVVIPNEIKQENVQKIEIPQIKKPEINTNIPVKNDFIEELNIENDFVQEEKEPTPQVEVPQEPKKGRGRPRKNPLPQVVPDQPKRGRGRPKKNAVIEEKPVEEEVNEGVDLFNIEDHDENLQEDIRPIQEENDSEGIDLFNIQNEDTTEEKEIDLFNMDEDEEPEEEQEPEEVDLFNINEEPEQRTIENEEPVSARPEIEPPVFREAESENNYVTTTNNVINEMGSLITTDQKLVAFVGTTKNGTSFVVNNTAEVLASIGINTAILDMTKSKNAYYIYTNNEEELRNISRNCMENLEKGIVGGINVKKNLTVYADIPDEQKQYDVQNILKTLLANYSVVLVDTDFDTDIEVFKKVQELYLVQSMDVLTIQPLTAFLRNLKSKGILQPEKLRIVINKSEKVKGLGAKTLIAGMSCYNAPDMSYMTELFNRETIKYCEIPFETQNYVKYLESLVNCKVSLNGYTKQFLNSLKELSDMVYPLINKQEYSAMDKKQNRRDPFSSRVNDTLNMMKKQY